MNYIITPELEDEFERKLFELRNEKHIIGYFNGKPVYGV